jgi:hypothetical protein
LESDIQETITGIDQLLKMLIETAVVSSSDDSVLSKLINKSNIKGPIVEQQNNVDNTIACKHYSIADNLSQNYLYANPVPEQTCSEVTLPFNCGFPPAHFSICVGYIPDVEYLTTISLDQKDYIINKTRTVSGNINLDIVDSDSNFISKLSYPISVYNSSDIDMVSELKIIIKEIHDSSFLSNSNPVEINPIPAIPVKVKNSYLTSLISI